MDPQKIEAYLKEEETKGLWKEIIKHYQEGGEEKVMDFLLSKKKKLKEKLEKFSRESLL